MQCPVCGSEFAPKGRRRYCSHACRQAAYRERHPEVREDVPVKVETFCSECGDPSQGYDLCRFCSRRSMLLDWLERQGVADVAGAGARVIAASPSYYGPAEFVPGVLV